MRNFSSSFSLSGSYRRLRYSIRGTLLNIECALAYHSRARTTQSRQLVAVSITSLQCDCLGRLSRNRAQIVSRREQAVIRNLPKPCGTTSYLLSLSFLCIQSRTFLSSYIICITLYCDIKTDLSTLLCSMDSIIFTLHVLSGRSFYRVKMLVNVSQDIENHEH